MNRPQPENEFGVLPAHSRETSQHSNAVLTGRWLVLPLLLLASLPYAGVLGNDFTYIFDDKALIIDNPYVHNFQHWGKLFAGTLWTNLGPHLSAPYYRPLATAGFLLCYRVFGLVPWGFHLVSLLLNVVVVALVFLLAKQLFSDRAAAFAAATLFALHPAHVETVAWISDVSDIEVTLFCLLSFWCFLRLENWVGSRRLGLQAVMTASFALATLSKEQAISLPILATIYEHFYRRDRHETQRGQKLSRYGSLWLVLLGYLLLRTHVLGAFAHSTGVHQISAWQLVFSAIALMGQYLAILFLPLHLSSFHVFHASSSLFDGGVIAGVLGLIFLASVYGVLWKYFRPASFGILWLVLTLFPVLNARWLSYYVLAERYLYLPSVGFCLVSGWTCALLWQGFSRSLGISRTVWAALACLLSALCVLRINLRVLDWRSDISLFTEALAAQPGDFRLHGALGQAYWLRDDIPGAEREWQDTLRLEPNNVQALASLGTLYARERRFDRATWLLERALQLDPGAAAAHLSLGAVYAETAKLDQAQEQFRAAVQLSPANFNAHNLLGKVYFDAKRFNEAEAQFRESLQCEPNLAAYDHLGYIYMTRGDPGRAETAFKEALAVNDFDSHAHLNLGLIYAATSRQTRALVELQAAQAADPDNPEIRSALKQLRR